MPVLHPRLLRSRPLPPGEGAGRGSAALVPGDRRAALANLVATHLGVEPGAVRIDHREGRAPRLLMPSVPGLVLSASSRAGLAAVAVADGPVGIDVEVLSDELLADAAPPPWNVLHPAERAHLAGCAAADRPLAFLRVWTAKEAYLKALGTGLAREPASFAALPRGADEAVIADGACRAVARTHALGVGGAPGWVSVVRLPSGPRLDGRRPTR